MSKAHDKYMADRDYWLELADLVGWRFDRWIAREEGTYVVSRGRHLTLHAAERDDIVAAIKAEQVPEP